PRQLSLMAQLREMFAPLHFPHSLPNSRLAPQPAPLPLPASYHRKPQEPRSTQTHIPVPSPHPRRPATHPALQAPVHQASERVLMRNAFTPPNPSAMIFLVAIFSCPSLLWYRVMTSRSLGDNWFTQRSRHPSSCSDAPQSRCSGDVKSPVIGTYLNLRAFCRHTFFATP